MTDIGNDSMLQKTLRLWPGVVLLALQWFGRFLLPVFVPEALFYGVIGGVLTGLAIAVWWVFFSRASRLERWIAVPLMILGLVVTRLFLHESIRTAMMGMMFFIYAIPVLSLALVAWAVASRHLPAGPRRATMVATLLLACGGWTFLRTEGFDGQARNDFAWRWAPTPEARLLAQAEDETMRLAPPSATRETDAEWHGFRGRDRDSIIHDTRIDTDWTGTPPLAQWRRPVGPGWSSFAVSGDLFYTQEQRGDEEVVACYRVSSGEPVWRHGDPVRFWEANAGAGPRATPSLHAGRLYTLGATGILNALDAADGTVYWSRDAAADNSAQVPGWGFSGSPLLVDDVIIIALAGKLAAYDLASGEPRWSGPDGGDGYSSPQLLTFDGVPQILLMSSAGATSLAPADGSLLWEHPVQAGTRIVQPAQTADGDLLMSDGDSRGMRRLAVIRGADGWTATEGWTTRGLKPYFNDFVVHRGHAFGFDGSILACIDVATGERKWKGGRYGAGQLLLLADQDLLLVLSEKGDLALVAATIDQFSELARVPGIDGKTWNHPALAGDLLLVRNSEEMAAFRLTLKSS